MNSAVRSVGASIVAMLLIAFSESSSARFTSADPVPTNPNNGANFNRYSYANDNPYRFTDPDGRYGCDTNNNAGFCQRVADYRAGLQKSRDALRPSTAEFKKVDKALKSIGTENDGKGGSGGKEGSPTYISGTLKEGAGRSNGDGTTTLDTGKIDSSTDPIVTGATALGHEATHDMERPKDVKFTERAQFRKMEKSAYGTSAAVALGFGIVIPANTLNTYVERSTDIDMQNAGLSPP